jgi:hypothetical protein
MNPHPFGLRFFISFIRRQAFGLHRLFEMKKPPLRGGICFIICGSLDYSMIPAYPLESDQTKMPNPFGLRFFISFIRRQAFGLHRLSEMKKPPLRGGIFVCSSVIPLGFEPRTHTLKVYCSTS